MSYNYAELGWLHDQGGLPGSADGGYLDLSYEINNTHLFLDGTVSVLGGDYDYREYGAGLGYYVPLTKTFDFVVRSGWAYSDSDPGTGVHEWYISPGFRFQVTCDLELYAKAYFHVPQEGRSNWSGGAGAVYWVCSQAAIVAGGAIGEDNEWSVQAGLRFKL